MRGAFSLADEGGAAGQLSPFHSGHFEPFAHSAAFRAPRALPPPATYTPCIQRPSQDSRRFPAHFTLRDGSEITTPVHTLLNAGYAGRSQDDVAAHVKELAELGVPAPSVTPALYPVAPYLAQQAGADRLTFKG
nr:DUF2848 family protein [Amycolatopsis sp. DSM 110486]